VSVPAALTIPAGATSKQFIITTTPVTAPLTVTITADYNGVTKTANLTVTPPGLVSLFLSPASVKGGGSTTSNKVTLNGPAPAGGVVVALASSDAGVTVPASVTIPGGSTASPLFSIATTPVGANTTVTISATLNGASVTATLTITP